MSEKRRGSYAAEFRRQMVELVRAGRGPEELAREFEPSAQTIRNWVAQADRDEGRRQDGLTSEERDEQGVRDVSQRKTMAILVGGGPAPGINSVVGAAPA